MTGNSTTNHTNMEKKIRNEIQERFSFKLCGYISFGFLPVRDSSWLKILKIHVKQFEIVDLYSGNLYN